MTDREALRRLLAETAIEVVHVEPRPQGEQGGEAVKLDMDAWLAMTPGEKLARIDALIAVNQAPSVAEMLWLARAARAAIQADEMADHCKAGPAAARSARRRFLEWRKTL